MHQLFFSRDSYDVANVSSLAGKHSCGSRGRSVARVALPTVALTMNMNHAALNLSCTRGEEIHPSPICPTEEVQVWTEETIVWSGESGCTHHCWLSYVQLTVPLLSSSQTYVDLRNPQTLLVGWILAGVDLSWLREKYCLKQQNRWLLLSLHDSVGGSRGVPRVLNTCRLRSSFIY